MKLYHFISSTSELNVLDSAADKGIDLSNERDHRHELSTVLLADNPELHRRVDLRNGKLLVNSSDESLAALSDLVASEPRNIESDVFTPALEVAVRADPDVASTAEEKHPAIDDETEGLKEDLLEEAPETERQMDQVDDPDEETGAEAAVPAEGKEESKVQGVIDESHGENDGPPRERDDGNHVHFSEPGRELDGPDDPAREASFAFLFRFFSSFDSQGGFFIAAVTADFLPIEFDLADLEPILSVALFPHLLASRVHVVDPLVLIIVWAPADRLPANTIFVFVRELGFVRDRGVLTDGSSRRILHEQGVHGSCQGDSTLHFLYKL